MNISDNKNNHNLKLAFIVPARNVATLLPLCLNSLIKQSIPRDHFEIIVIDHDSEDNTSEVAAEFADRLIKSSAATIAEVKNIGAAASQAKIIAFIDSDTELPRDWAETALNLLASTAAVAVGSHYSLPTRSDYIGKIITKLNSLETRQQAETDWFLRALALPRDIFFEVKGFDEKLLTCEDVDLGYRLKSKGKLIADQKLNPKHLDDPVSLKDLFRKEYWRGQDSIIILVKHRFLFKELIYLLMQLWFWIGLLFLLNSALVLNIKMLLISFALLILPPFLLTIKAVLRSKETKGSPALLLYFIVFYSARSLVCGRSLSRLINYYFRQK